jgi:hypothetical protein
MINKTFELLEKVRLIKLCNFWNDPKPRGRLPVVRMNSTQSHTLRCTHTETLTLLVRAARSYRDLYLWSVDALTQQLNEVSTAPASFVLSWCVWQRPPDLHPASIPQVGR